MSVRPASLQISLGIRRVWSESSLCAQWLAKDPSFFHANSEDSDLSLRWAHIHVVGFVMPRLKCSEQMEALIETSRQIGQRPLTWVLVCPEKSNAAFPATKGK